MKFLFSLLLVAGPFFAFSQSTQQSFDLQGAKSIHIKADYSSVRVITGGTSAISVTHVLMVDGEERPDLRKLEIERRNGTLYLQEVKPTADLLLKELSISGERDLHIGKENGVRVINGITTDATLEVIVPEGILVEVESLYGGIEIIGVQSLVSASATYGPVDIIYTDAPSKNIEAYSNYGAVDITLPSGTGANLELTTQYGELFTNTDIAIDVSKSEQRDFYDRTVGTVSGGGPTISCEAPYGDVYFRAN